MARKTVRTQVQPLSSTSFVVKIYTDDVTPNELLDTVIVMAPNAQRAPMHAMIRYNGRPLRGELLRYEVTVNA